MEDLGEEDDNDPEAEANRQTVTDASTKRGSIISLSDLKGAPESKKRELAEMLEISELQQVKDLFQFKEKYARPLSEQEKQLSRDIQSNRACYEVDQFVKLSEVRSLVNEGFQAIHKEMLRTQATANKARDDMSKLNSRLKICLQQVNHVSRMKRNFEDIFAEIKVQEMKTVELEAKHNNEIERIETNMQIQQCAYEEIMKKTTRLQAVSENLDS